MKRSEFIGVYVASFLASYNAVRYEMACLDGTAGDLAVLKHQPVEDAVCMAEEAWLGYREHVVEPEKARSLRIFNSIVNPPASQGKPKPGILMKIVRICFGGPLDDSKDV